MLSDQQKKERPHHVGASEVAALFGLDAEFDLDGNLVQRRTKYQLWHEKKGNYIPEDIGEEDRPFWGNILEPAIAAGVAKKNGWSIRAVEEYWSSPEVRGMGASADFEIMNDPRGPIPLEIKNVDWLVFKKWNNDQPPMKFMLQLQQQIACHPSGAQAGVLAVLVGGNDPHLFPFDRHEPSIAKIKTGIREFWDSIDRNEPPEPDFYVDLEVIQSIYGKPTEGSVKRFFEPRLVELCQLYERHRSEEKNSEREKKRMKAEILTLIRETEEAYCEGFKILAPERGEAWVEGYTRQAYRDFRIYPHVPGKKSKKSRR